MAPKKQQKMSLNEFLGDNALGSWADEMDALPTAPAARSDGLGGLSGAPDRGRRDDFLSSRSDRGPPREDLPLPTEPPYTAFVGNLAFDLAEGELEEFFSPIQTKSVKIIRDRDDRPKGFGYIEFADLDGLKDALAKSGSSFAGRTVRVSVAEPPKERSGFGGSGGFDDEKFAGPWRRDGPLPDLSSRDDSRRRFEGAPGPRDREPLPPSVSDTTSDWRSAARGPVRGASPPRFAKRTSFREDAPASRADAEDTWVRGAKFQPSAPPAEGPGSRFGAARGRGDMGPPPAQSQPEESDWRRPSAISRNSTSPSGSTPPTPQMGRRKLELLPRSSGPSVTPSPLASPNPANAAPSATRSNPFGTAKPVDVSAKEHEVEQRLEKEKEAVKERTTHTMSRTSSRQASHHGRTRDGPTPPTSAVTSPVSPSAESHRSLPRNATEPSVRPTFSFASAAAGKKDLPEDVPEEKGVEDATEKLGEVTI